MQTPSPLPPPSPPSTPSLLHPWFRDLPDPALEAIALCLGANDLLRLMESSRWSQEAFGGRVRSVALSDDPRNMLTPQTVRSILCRRPALVQATIRGCACLKGLEEALIGAYCRKLQSLDICPAIGDQSLQATALLGLLKTLGDGGAPCLDRLSLPLRDPTDMVPALGEALQSRMARGSGCCGLKSLEFKASALTLTKLPDLSPILLSAACDTLEELLLPRYTIHGRAGDDLAEWLACKARQHLRHLSIQSISAHIATALASSPFPGLTLLQFEDIGPEGVSILAEAIEHHGALSSLKVLRVSLSRGIRECSPQLIGAMLGGGMRSLRVLRLFGQGVGHEGGMAVARGLRGGGCPLLEDLDLQAACVGDGGIVDITRALEEAAARASGGVVALQRLRLAHCKFGAETLKALGGMLSTGVCRQLEFVDLSHNDVGDDGVLALADALQEGLPRLIELDLDRVGMGDHGALALYQAVGVQGGCPKLRRLSVRYNKGISWRVKRGLVEKLGGGRGIHVEYE